MTFKPASVNVLSMFEIKKFLKPAVDLTALLLREQLFPLLILLGATSAINIGSELYLADLDKNADSARLFVQLGVGLWGLLEGILLLLALSKGIPRVRSFTLPALQPKPFAGDYLGSFLAEYFRGLGQVLLWSLVVLIPGFFRYVRLLFLPYVVLFAKAYREGHVDAIALSRALTQGRMPTLIAMTVLPAAIEIGLVFLPQVVDAFHVWPVRIVIDAVGYLLSIYMFAYLYLMFEDALAHHDQQGQRNGSDV